MGSPLVDTRVTEGGELVVVGLPNPFKEFHRGSGLLFIYFGQCEPYVDEHPLAGRRRVVGEGRC